MVSPTFDRTRVGAGFGGTIADWRLHERADAARVARAWESV